MSYYCEKFKISTQKTVFRLKINEFIDDEYSFRTVDNNFLLILLNTKELQREKHKVMAKMGRKMDLIFECFKEA